MKVHLFNPPVYHYNAGHLRLNPPLGLPTIAAMLRDAGHKARVIDLEAMGIHPTVLRESFTAQQKSWPDAIGFTTTYNNALGTLQCIEGVRAAGYKGYVVVGGPQATVAPEMFKDAADCVVMGECEGNVLEIFEKQPRGTVYGVPAVDINTIPTPAWELHTPSPMDYMGNQPHLGRPEGIMMMSRGCPHLCIFCANPVFGHQKIRFFGPMRIRHDLEVLKGMGATSIFAYDDELVGLSEGQNKWLQVVSGTIESLGLTLKGQGRCSERVIKLEVLQAMQKAGFRAIMWGVESFSDSVLKSIKKGTKETDIWHTLRTSREAGIGNWLFLMVGNYGETEEDLEHTRKQLEKARAEGLVQWHQVTVCTPMPGTELWELAQKEGWLVPPPTGGSQMHQVYNKTPWLTAQQIEYWKGVLERT